VDIENQYYNAKGDQKKPYAKITPLCVLNFIRNWTLFVSNIIVHHYTYLNVGMKDSDDPRESIEGFNQVVSMEGEKGEWWVKSSWNEVVWYVNLFMILISQCRGFKALKQLVKLYYKTKKYDKMMESYRWALFDESCDKGLSFNKVLAFTIKFTSPWAVWGPMILSLWCLPMISCRQRPSHTSVACGKTVSYLPSPVCMLFLTWVLFVHRTMLMYIDSAVTKNASEKKINSLSDFMAQVIFLPQTCDIGSKGLWAKVSNTQIAPSIHMVYLPKYFISRVVCQGMNPCFYPYV
jgi:hypothetical protein